MEVEANAKKKQWTKSEQNERLLAKRWEISEQRKEELIDFATQAVALGRNVFLDVYNSDPSLKWWIFDFARLEKTELHEEFYRVCIRPGELEKKEKRDVYIKDKLEKNRIELSKKMEMYGDQYQIINKYTAIDMNDVEYKTITVGIPFRDKDERRERIYCSMCINDVEHPSTYLHCLSNYKLRQPKPMK